jgi:D-sedoheptulose 7-phosphate isomerase
MKFINNYLKKLQNVITSFDKKAINLLIKNLKILKKNKGRLFIIGVGGSAGNASHAVNDFRKICEIECYAPTDNVSELTARTNDQGWENTLHPYLRVSKLSQKDAILIFSVGGGSKKKNISTNIVKAIDYAKSKKAKVLAIVGKSDGYAAKKADSCFVLPKINEKLFLTPFAETIQPLIWHLLVTHPDLQINKTTW